MTAFYKDALLRAEKYASQYGRVIKEQIGGGVDGVVLSTLSKSAIKSLRYQEQYLREKGVYLRLFENDVFEVRGFSVPKLIEFDDNLWVIEMEIVSPPFVLDFAAAYLDERPDFPEEIMQDWVKEKREQFEEDWPIVQEIIDDFEKYGIFLSDVKPGNISFENPAQ